MLSMAEIELINIYEQATGVKTTDKDELERILKYMLRLARYVENERKKRLESEGDK